ncbi:MAG: DUF1801 domain-containing protein [Thermoplasmata archaeon]
MPSRKHVARSTAPEGDLGRVSEAVHEVVRAIGPDLTIVKKWGMPWYTGRDLVVLVGTFQRHVAVEFWRGTSLRDPHHLLEGTGKNMRHVKLRSVAAATAPALIALFREAIRLDLAEEPRPR